MKRKLVSILTVLLVTTGFLLTGCSKTLYNTEVHESKIPVTSANSESIGKVDTYIELGASIKTEGSGVDIENNIVKITKGGTYSISGTLSEGQIVIEATKLDKVYIVLNGVNITNSKGAAIYIKEADKAVIAMEDNTDNYLTDGKTYAFEDENKDEPNGTIFSKTDLVFIGNGSLTVNGNYDRGIVGKDDLQIENGNITVNSVGDGIRGRDSIVVTGGDIVINSGGDGMQSNNDENTEKGYVLIEGGNINITSNEDGIQGENNVYVRNGEIKINSGGGSDNNNSHKNQGPGENMGRNQEISNTSSESLEESASSKGIKANTGIIIEGGILNINSCDDSLHTNDSLIIDGGALEIQSGDDGIHSDNTLEINGGNINVSKSYEGIESESITINNGEIYVASSDDGINASGSSTSEEMTPPSGNNTPDSSQNSDGTSSKMQGTGQGAGSGMPGIGESSGTGVLTINGGFITVDASGDGIDVNGCATMTGGTVIVNGPENNGNGALDYDGTFEVSGGVLIAAGSTGMAQAPSDGSSINSIKLTLSSQSAENIVRIEDEDGNEIVTFAPAKQYASIVIASSEFETGSTYNVYVGGSSDGNSNSGLYEGGNYKDGERIMSFTINEKITSSVQDGVSAQSMGKGGRGMRQP
ncbi:carbohydrate-binding domain-containing protein [Clostridium butyricum]|uniref:carbohydrate-binding domain-containing protein n=1 Tax=Clostridium butyricum TaxID=1492 RepID=UPI000F547B05|nr:carbohydrate-binding domain-containing protein [Clostridium butyricum]RQN01653.1 carbohydrate-binding domain-containing protein [Clostridium butyricum]